ncbi:hypothetical protein H0H87_005078 [Tephrocybe sp. NHM501043]|nr:hypothetical protein H0H87_005078 [Tephrocybe sp. NHM501043]
MSTDIDLTRLEEDVVTWLAIDSGRKIVFISFTLIIYEYFITLDKEVMYFWSGKWTPSRFLYLMNRYLPPVIMSSPLICGSTERGLHAVHIAAIGPFEQSSAYRQSHFSRSKASALSQEHLSLLNRSAGILVVRVFYMFEHNLIARIIIAFTYAAAIVSTITALALVMVGTVLLKPLDTLAHVVDLVGCPVRTMTDFWHLYIPAFSLHTVLYIFTLIRVLNCDDSPQSPLIRRLHRE